jgi:hypothetical protein
MARYCAVTVTVQRHGAVASDRAGWFSDDGELTQILPVGPRPDLHRVVSLAVVRGSPA